VIEMLMDEMIRKEAIWAKTDRYTIKNLSTLPSIVLNALDHCSGKKR
jgi:hypothetical protein